MALPAIDSVSDEPALLELEPLGGGRFRAPHEMGGDVPRTVIFGGQILAQMIMVSELVAPGKNVEAIHTIFARAGDFRLPLEYEIEGMHAGRGFASDTVSAWQGDRLIARGLLLKTAQEPDLIRHAAPMPSVPGPEDTRQMTTPSLVFPGAEMRFVDHVDTWSVDHPIGPPELYVWTRYPVPVSSVARAQAVLAWATDGFLIGTAMRPHAGMGQDLAHRTISTGVVSHSLSFHEQFDVSEWLLLAHESVHAGGGRTHGRALIFTQDGKLVASYTQDNMVCHFADQQDHSADYSKIM